MNFLLWTVMTKVQGPFSKTAQDKIYTENTEKPYLVAVEISTEGKNTTVEPRLSVDDGILEPCGLINGLNQASELFRHSLN